MTATNTISSNNSNQLSIDHKIQMEWTTMEELLLQTMQLDRTNKIL